MSDTSQSANAPTPAAATQGGRVTAGRPDRQSVVAFVSDATSEAILRDGLTDVTDLKAGRSLDLRRGTVRQAISAMTRLAPPQILIVDVTGEDRPLELLAELCDVVEPSVSLVVLGDIDDVDFYRAVLRRIGALEYMFKPITREMVARYFGPLITRKAVAGESTRGGRVIAITGARGGVGSSMIATSLAWYLGVTSSRHALLLDADPLAGVSALMFGIDPQPPLSSLLSGAVPYEAADIEDLAAPVENRLSVLCDVPDPQRSIAPAAGAVRRLIDAVRLRFNFIVVDLPLMSSTFSRELLDLTHHRVIVLDPSLAALRDTIRFLALPNGPWQPQRPTILLNGEGRPGALPRKKIEGALKRGIDISIPEIAKLCGVSPHPATIRRLHAGQVDRAVQALAREIGLDSARTSSGYRAALMRRARRLVRISRHGALQPDAQRTL